MHVVAFAPAFRATAEENGGLRTEGFPMTSCHVDAFPKQITLPIVVAVHTSGGTDYDPRLAIVATSPEGQQLSAAECSWHWPDRPGTPYKYWVLTQNLTIPVQDAGIYHLALVDGPNSEPMARFPLPVARFNPLLPPRG